MFDSLIETAQATISDSEYNARYDGTYRLNSVGVSIPARVRALEMNVNWDRLTVDSMAEVLTVEGFEGADTDTELLRGVWDVWQRSDMRSRSHLAHTEALTQGVAYAIVGQDTSGRVVTTIHPKDGFAVSHDSSGAIVEAVRTFSEKNADEDVHYATYYTEQSIEDYVSDDGTTWRRLRKRPSIGLVPVIPVVNKTRLSDRTGRSEIDLVKSYSDAASRSATLLQLATELMSMPQRYILGASFDDFKNQAGDIKTAAEVYLGSFLMSSTPDAKAGQFEGANLEQIVSVLKYWAECVSAMTGIPASMLGLSTGHPSSAEAMRAAKERMISRGELKQGVFGDAWEQWARVVIALQGGSLDGTDTLSTVWRDIAVPSNSAKAAHLLQAHAQGVISAHTARDGLPLTPEQRAREDKNDIEAEEFGLLSPIREVAA